MFSRSDSDSEGENPERKKLQEQLMGKEMKICASDSVFVCVILTYLNSVLMYMNSFGKKSLPKMNAKPKLESVVMRLNCKTSSSVVVVLVNH